ncbi:hypothetical protein B0H17DRAFT_523699 [Mycena rosella]|uniref:Uncharacterized protein n=1 Tax=Mycena rosella TaxID=1033263 RepID=A0AAD7MAC0_MYCRO|nr:hypothetical protein B0H17DRAFT_523699 [Mycena rosella]
MFATLLTLALFAAPALNGVAALNINTPALVQCGSAQITWDASTGPYNLIVVDSAMPVALFSLTSATTTAPALPGKSTSPPTNPSCSRSRMPTATRHGPVLWRELRCLLPEQRSCCVQQRPCCRFSTSTIDDATLTSVPPVPP